MSIYSTVTEQDLINLRKLAEQQKNQRALRIKNRNLKQTLDIKLAESLSYITKKLDEVKESAQKLGNVDKKSISGNERNQEMVPVENKSQDEDIQTNLRPLPNSSIFSDLMAKTLGRLMSSPNSLQIKASPSSPTFLGVPIYTLGGYKLRVRDNHYDLTPEI